MKLSLTPRTCSQAEFREQDIWRSSSPEYPQVQQIRACPVPHDWYLLEVAHFLLSIKVYHYLISASYQALSPGLT